MSSHTHIDLARLMMEVAWSSILYNINEAQKFYMVDGQLTSNNYNTTATVLTICVNDRLENHLHHNNHQYHYIHNQKDNDQNPKDD